jgi:hypothetical protein
MPRPDEEGDEAVLARLRLPERPAPHRPKRSGAGFAKMSNGAAVAGYHALGCPRAIVWHYIHYRVWAEGVQTIPLANRTLVDMGVSRYTKYRALLSLEQAGLIRVEHRQRRSPLVTLL